MLVLSSVLPGCGFRLAGSSESFDHLQNISVSGVRSSHELVYFTREYLGLDRVDIVEPGSAAIRLDILSEETEKEVLSLDANGKAREYELMLNVTFDVKRPDDSVLLPRQGIRLNRVLVFDKLDVLGSAEEEHQLLQEMRKDMAQLIMHRLRAIILD